MNNEGLTLNQLAERNAELVTEVEKLRSERDQLAAENVAAKKIISECREYFNAGVMDRIRPTNEGYLHMICDTFADETPATDRIVAGIKADGVEEFVKNAEKNKNRPFLQISGTTGGLPVSTLMISPSSCAR